ncbi:GntR family transcriptional regulator [Nocardia huaxiensis]|uniref:FCD domain-containing protein n=1 Tax=Nocardia huaxiensis TaxID=2755382 RepID=A0A7D6VFU1_9NOCA|nr:FCD domain-containing protein [Nocardia huaxiensis]QLY31615.1 FCD domain-containing protein [Nocardia huaxiensis]UFS95169.1 FCD domain-containing protein [Nocardia huaxiensis]
MAEHTDALSALQQQVADRRSTSLLQLIARQLEQMIINGALRGGDRINESALALQLGTSRGPVREALRQLEHSRLVEFRTNRGMFVREISVEEAAQLYDVRAALFGLAGRLAAERATPEDVEALRAKVSRLADAVPAVDDYYPGNVDLHRDLVALSGNPRLIDLYDDVSKELHLFRRHGLETENARHTSNCQHAEILDRLAEGDADEAGRLMEAHIRSGKQRMLAAVHD